MKKAYVKPVFLAEEFVATASYMASGCDPNANITNAILMKSGVNFCKYHSDEITGEGHCAWEFKEGGKMHTENGYSGLEGVTAPEGIDTYWEYATYGDNEAYLFTGDNTLCDFAWSGKNTDNVYVWNSVEKQNSTVDGFLAKLINTTFSFSKLFFDNASDHGNGHECGYKRATFRS